MSETKPDRRVTVDSYWQHYQGDVCQVVFLMKEESTQKDLLICQQITEKGKKNKIKAIYKDAFLETFKDKDNKEFYQYLKINYQRR